MICEKCWSDAFVLTFSNTSKSQYDHYLDLIKNHNHINKMTEKNAAKNVIVCVDPGISTNIIVIIDGVVKINKSISMFRAIKEFDMYFTTAVKYKRKIIVKDTRKLDLVLSKEIFEIWIEELDKEKIKYKVFSEEKFDKLTKEAQKTLG